MSEHPTPTIEGSSDQFKDWFALQSDRVKQNTSCVSAKELGQKYMLRIDKAVPPHFYPMMPKSASDTEDNTCPRVCVSPNVMGCFIGYHRGIDDFLNGHDKSDESNQDYRGGYLISAIEFDECLKVNDELVPGAEKSQEHWLVGYSEKTRTYEHISAGKLFLANYFLSANNAKSPQCIAEFFIEVTLSDGLMLAQGLHLTAGYWRIKAHWSDPKLADSRQSLDYEFHSIDAGTYMSAKNLSAALLNKPVTGTLYHANFANKNELAAEFSLIAANRFSEFSSNLYLHADRDENKAIQCALDEWVCNQYIVASINKHLSFGKKHLDYTFDQSVSPDRSVFEKLDVYLYRFESQPEDGWLTVPSDQVWPRGNFRLEGRIKADRFVSVTKVNIGKWLKEQKITLGLFANHMGRNYNTPTQLYHGSMFKQKELKPGYLHTGIKVQWDGVESNEFLYAITDRAQAIDMAFASYLDKNFAIDHFQTRDNQVIVTLSGQTLPTSEDFKGQKLYIYTLEFRLSDGWIKNDNYMNGMVGEYKTIQTLGEDTIKAVEVVYLEDYVREKMVIFKPKKKSFADW